MKKEQRITTADLQRLAIEALTAFEQATQKLADETQRQAARYQREADKARKELKRRNHVAKSTS